MHKNLLYCVIVEVAVSRAHQSQGIGSRLLHAAEVWGREQGADLASLEYLAENTRAANFYHDRMRYRPAHITAIKRL
jgi:ribosomal protein S18 acetylase RimI-like enzyme